MMKPFQKWSFQNESCREHVVTTLFVFVASTLFVPTGDTKYQAGAYRCLYTFDAYHFSHIKS